MTTAQPAGTLYVVATPIGHLGDLSARAVSVLGQVSRVLAEDTRNSRVLLQHYGIQTPLEALHEHNETARLPGLLARLHAGEDLALISDAGTPLLSDPGFPLVRAAREAGLTVTPIPGACALIAALSAASLPTDRFSFEGFLPAKSAARRAALEALRHDPRTLIWYEAPHRILDSLDDCAAVLGGERRAVLARELTKRHETFLGGTLAQIGAQLRTDPQQQRGEMVLLLAGAPAAAEADAAELERVLGVLLDELPAGQAASLAARLCAVPRKRAYAAALALRPGA
jgi:16S rRNA (cytidine1402-2'-O)-methyltransferase